MRSQEFVERTRAFVKNSLERAEAGHDWFHVLRVWNNALAIAEEEPAANRLVVSLGALLHDIADSKFHDGDESLGPQRTRDFLTGIGLDNETVAEVTQIVAQISFKNSLDPQANRMVPSLELQIVRDADRLDALGAIGIARAFNYGGYKNRIFYNPEVPPNLHMDKAAYSRNTGTTINHFYEKLLLLKDRMHTKKGRAMAEKRHEFMLLFLDRFYTEWENKPLVDGNSEA